MKKPVDPNPKIKSSAKRAKASVRMQDPYLERERAQYDFPLPSREFVLQILAERGVPISSEELAQMLEITEDEIDVFNRRLRAMLFSSR